MCVSVSRLFPLELLLICRQLFLRPKNADGSGPLEIFVSNLHCEILRMKGTVRVICHSGSTEDDRAKGETGFRSLPLKLNNVVVVQTSFASCHRRVATDLESF